MEYHHWLNAQHRLPIYNMLVVKASKNRVKYVKKWHERVRAAGECTVCFVVFILFVLLLFVVNKKSHWTGDGLILLFVLVFVCCVGCLGWCDAYVT